MNKKKSAVFLAPIVRSVLQIDTVALVEKYLGLPIALGCSSKESYEYMSIRLKKLLGACCEKEASCAGRERCCSNRLHK